MGAYKSFFEKNEQEKQLILNSNKGDFITGHADLTGLAVVEVQRLWTRFNQLGCDKKGFITKKKLEKGELSQDAFTKNIIANLPKEPDGSLSFLVFLKFIQWVDSADEETKLKAIFNFLNNGNDLDTMVIDSILKKIYPNATNEEIRETTEIIMQQLDTKKSGKINETQFVTNIFRNYTEDELRSLLKIEIIPTEVLEETNMQPSLAGSQINMKSEKNVELKSELDDHTLEIIATKVMKKNWEKFAIKLGFLENDIQSIKLKNNGSNYETLIEILFQWRDQDPYLATKNRLKKYLEESNMLDAAAILK